MFDKEEHTLFKPAAAPRGGGSDAPPAQNYAAPGRSGGGQSDEDEERASLGETLLFALNSAKRRLFLSGFVVLVGAGATFGAAKLAPRSYVSAGEVLVSKPPNEQAGWNPDRDKREQLEWAKQIKQRSTIENIIKDAKLVERWDDMRQPYRKLLDKTNDKPPTPEQKFGMLVGMLEGKLQLNIDQTTVTIMVEWPEPEAARDIVDAAMKRFIDKRYETEVSRTLNAIKPLEEQLEGARLELEKLSPSLAPPKEKPTLAVLPSQSNGGAATAPDPAVLSRLAAAKEKQAGALNKLQELEGQKNQRIQGIQNQLSEKSTVLGPANPEIIALKAQLDAAQKDPPDLAAARAAKSAADEEVANLSAQAGVAVPRIPTRVALPPIPTDKKLDEQTLAKIASARARYDQALSELDKQRITLKTAEEDFKIKYQVSHPPDVPFAPKKPVGLMVAIGGIIITLVLVLLLASLRDRATGIMFEAKQVRDKLRLPILGDIKERDFA
jgi:hypothetical protein